MAAINTTFGTLLHRAIAESGKSLTQIVAELADRGCSCTQATLSYWQSGRSLPRRQSSLAILGDLEEVLFLESGTLIEALSHNHMLSGDAPVSTSTASSSPNLKISSETSPALRFDEGAIDWSHEVTREILIERVAISADGRTESEDVTALVRIPSSGTGTFHIGYHWQPTSQDSKADLGLSHLTGAEVAERIAFEERTGITRLVLPRTAAPGSLHQLAYRNATRAALPFEQTTERLFPWPLRFYSCHVIFEGEVPEHIEWVQSVIENDDLNSRRIVTTRELVPFEKTVQVSMEDVMPGSSVIKW